MIATGNFGSPNWTPYTDGSRIVILVLIPTCSNIAAMALVRIRHDLGLDRPILLQYVVFIGDVLRGNWRESIRNHQPVFTLILERVPATLELGLAAFMLAAEEGWTRRGC